MKEANIYCIPKVFAMSICFPVSLFLLFFFFKLSITLPIQSHINKLSTVTLGLTLSYIKRFLAYFQIPHFLQNPIFR